MDGHLSLGQTLNSIAFRMLRRLGFANRGRCFEYEGTEVKVGDVKVMEVKLTEVKVVEVKVTECKMTDYSMITA